MVGGVRALNLGRLFLNRASAIGLWIPDRCWGMREMEWSERMKKRHLSKCMTVLFLAEPDFKLWTTAMLSQRISTVEPIQSLSRKARAIAMYRSSFAVMSNCCQGWGH